MSRAAVRPYLVARDAEGDYRVTVRTTRFNSVGYPLVTSTMVDQTFRTATAARAYVRDTLGGLPSEIGLK